MALPYRLELLIRRLLPEPVKSGLRACRVLFRPAPPRAPHIPQELLTGARLISERVAMLAELPKGGRACELGVLGGDFSRYILDIAQPERLDLVDITFARCRADVLADGRVHAHAMLTTDYLATVDDGAFDWIYVDADHRYEAVTADIAAAKAKVKPGGLLIFNDFARIIRPNLGTLGVHQAVCEFIVRARWPVVMLAMDGEALYDIALRRPD